MIDVCSFRKWRVIELIQHKKNKHSNALLTPICMMYYAMMRSCNMKTSFQLLNFFEVFLFLLTLTLIKSIFIEIVYNKLINTTSFVFPQGSKILNISHPMYNHTYITISTFVYIYCLVFAVVILFHKLAPSLASWCTYYSNTWL
jgi:hypothetical protein